MSADSQDPVETQVNDIFKSAGFMLTKIALARGMIADANGNTEKGQLVYSALSYASILYHGSTTLPVTFKIDHTLSGKYLLFAIHTMHKMRTHGTQMSRLIAKGTIAGLLGIGNPLLILGGAITWFQHKVGVKFAKRFFNGIRSKKFGINWTARFARSYFKDLKQKDEDGEHGSGRSLHDELLLNGLEIVHDNERLQDLEEAYTTVDKDFKQNMGTAPAFFRKKSGDKFF